MFCVVVFALTSQSSFITGNNNPVDYLQHHDRWERHRSSVFKRSSSSSLVEPFVSSEDQFAKTDVRKSLRFVLVSTSSDGFCLRFVIVASSSVRKRCDFVTLIRLGFAFDLLFVSIALLIDHPNHRTAHLGWRTHRTKTNYSSDFDTPSRYDERRSKSEMKRVAGPFLGKSKPTKISQLDVNQFIPAGTAKYADAVRSKLARQ